MTRKQVCNQITQFTGDWKGAKRKADIFEQNCCVPLRQVKSIVLSFGKAWQVDEKGNHFFGENRNTLNFLYLTNKGEKYHFGILD